MTKQVTRRAPEGATWRSAGGKLRAGLGVAETGAPCLPRGRGKTAEVAQSTLTCRRWAAWCRSTRSRASMGCTASFDGTSVVSIPDAASSTPWPPARCSCLWTRGVAGAQRVLDVEMLAADFCSFTWRRHRAEHRRALRRPSPLRPASPRRPGRVDVSTRHGSLEGRAPGGDLHRHRHDRDAAVRRAGGGPSRSQPALPRATQLPSHPGAHRADRHRARRAIAAGRYVLGRTRCGGRRAVA